MIRPLKKSYSLSKFIGEEGKSGYLTRQIQVFWWYCVKMMRFSTKMMRFSGSGVSFVYIFSSRPTAHPKSWWNFVGSEHTKNDEITLASGFGRFEMLSKWFPFFFQLTGDGDFVCSNPTDTLGLGVYSFVFSMDIIRYSPNHFQPALQTGCSKFGT